MIVDVIKHALMITSFVLMMMFLIEYINVQTRGVWQNSLKKSRFGQYILAAFLGVVPGCLGAFTVVSLYSHRMVSFGALVAAMIATSGDEAFVMLSMFPSEALLLNAILFVTALATAYVVDFTFRNQNNFLKASQHEFELHEEENCHCFDINEILRQLKQMTFPRAFLITLFVLFLAAVLSGELGPQVWNWKKITFTIGAGISLLIVVSVPDHFLEQHLYEHVIKKHLLRIFLWTFAALLVVHFIQNYLNLDIWLKENTLAVLITATLVGIIPESGPHLIFATLYANGVVPFAVLLASSISQDGHGTLPLLAFSVRTYIWLKIVNIIVALLIGMLFLSFMR